MENKQRLYWLDGIKGIACLLIFAHHFLLTFYPSIHYGDTVPSKLNGIDVYLSQSPLSVLFNGNFLVGLFCLISGMVISMQVMSLADKDNLADVVFKRYFRLMLPVIPIGMLVFVLMNTNAFTNLAAAEITGSPWAIKYYTEALSFGEVLKSVFIDIWFFGDLSLSTAFWMMSTLFYGTFLSVMLSVIFWRFKKHIWIIYILAALAFFNRSHLYLAFVLGTLLALLVCNYPKCFNKYLGLVSVLAGLLLGGYPSGTEPTNLYRILKGVSSTDWHIVGAFFIVYGVLCLKPLQRFFSVGVFKFFGKISYAVYLIHIPLLFSFTCTLFIALNKNLPYDCSVLLCFIASLALLIAISFLYNRYVEKLCVYVQRKFCSVFLKQTDKGDFKI